MTDEGAIRAAVREGVRAELDAREARDREAARREALDKARDGLGFACTFAGIAAARTIDWALWGTSVFDAPSFPWWRMAGICAMGLSLGLLCAWLCGAVGPDAPDAGRAGAGEGRDA